MGSPSLAGLKTRWTMPSTQADLSVLRPFTPEDLRRYVSFLRKQGAEAVAAAVEVAAKRDGIPALN
jgi:hypothetical protein